MTVSVSPAPPIDYPDVPATALVRGAANRWGEATMLHQQGREISFAGLFARAAAFANALRGSGVSHGDVVALHLPNCPQYAIGYFGTLLAGAVVTPANPLLPPDDLAAQLADSGAVAVLTWEPALRAVTATRDRTSLRTVLVTGPEQIVDPAHRYDGGEGVTDFEQFHADAATTAPEVQIDPAHDLAHLAYTGGTTGRSKGVRITHRNVVVNTLQTSCWGTGAIPAVVDGPHGRGVVLVDQGPASEFPTRLGEGSTIGIAPWFHAMGAIGGLNVPLLTGGRTVVHGRFDPAAYLVDALRFEITSMSGAPPVFAALLAHRGAAESLSSVRALTSGAAPLPGEVIAGLQAWLGSDIVISEGYGLTEVTMAATLGPAGRSAERRTGTVGRPISDTEVRIVDEYGNEVAAGTEGEVHIRGPQVMDGYLDRPEDNAATFVDGWLRTGDVGVLDEDGFLRIVDRQKDMLLYKGYNVYPRELEELLLAQTGVLGAAVVGRPDATAGELPVAFLVAPELDQAGAEAAIEAVNERVVHYKRIREVRLVEQIPVSAAGKVLKRELRQGLATG
ncbi:class I adenylate-forming enzyme family protein [Pseudonocardia sp. KRD291]|uniref:class I adenylate-forming enzyme family protein n=1 Tax=Pseudonocardia sp. KRD291 TaxID=2792007 RepID=UPI001C4A742E|nr:AMP-binding protein [Pseudonocardia sp. KRD291]MBW0102313.1 AMP-binding protein [Pseudonocardia sp. KRD291]